MKKQILCAKVLVLAICILLGAGIPSVLAGSFVKDSFLPLTSGQNGSLWISATPDEMYYGDCGGRVAFGGGVAPYKFEYDRRIQMSGGSGANSFTFCGTITGYFTFQVWDAAGRTTNANVRILPKTSGGSSNSGDVLGRVWNVTEGDSSWTGVWTRRGNSNTFDAVWRHTSGQTSSGVVTINLSGNSVTISRGNGQYTGTISGQSASGTASWYSGGQRWSASIR